MIHHILYPTYIAKMQLRGKINISLRVIWVVICRGGSGSGPAGSVGGRCFRSLLRNFPATVRARACAHQVAGLRGIPYTLILPQ